MLRRLVLALALLAVPSAAMAQGAGARQGQGMRQGAMMGAQNAFQLLLEKKAEYKLTEEQVAKVDVIAKALEKKQEPLMKELQGLMQGGGMRNMTPAQRQDLMAKRQALQTEVEKEQEKLKTILTAEQHKQLTEELEKLAAQRRRPPPRG